MPGLLLNKYQLRTLTEMTGVKAAAWSPLAACPDVPRGCAPGEPDFVELVDKGLVVADGPYAWRPNRVAAAVMGAAASPDEVIGVKPSDPKIPGFTVIRRGELVSEFTLDMASGETHVVFPISRDAVLLRFIESLTKTGEDEPKPSFRARLTRNQAFLLSVAVRLLSTSIGDVTLTQLFDEARRDLAEPARLSHLAAAGMLPDLTETADLGPIFDGLERAGLLRHERATLGLGPGAEVLIEPVRAGFTLARTEVHDGVPRRDGILVTRHANRTLLLRTTSDPDPQIEWMECSRAQLRAMIAAFLLPTEQLEALIAHQQGTPPKSAPAKRAAAKPHAPTPAAPTPAAPTPPAPTPAGQPDRQVRVPAGGMPAFDSPSLAHPPTVRLAPGTPLVEAERRGPMARVRAENGWEGWVAHDRLEPDPAAQPRDRHPRMRVPARGLPAWSTPNLDQPPVTRLAGGLVLRTGSVKGPLIHVRAASGWEGWVAQDLLESL